MAILKFLLIFSMFYMVRSCPSNCFCEDYVGECIVESCEDSLPGENLAILQINGKLCHIHREMLKDNFLTEIILLNDYCGDIGNCK